MREVSGLKITEKNVLPLQLHLFKSSRIRTINRRPRLQILQWYGQPGTSKGRPRCCRCRGLVCCGVKVGVGKNARHINIALLEA